MKKLISALLCAALCVCLLSGFALADAGMGNFSKSAVYKAGQFSDVVAGDWFSGNVQAAYEYQFMLGVSASAFSPATDVTLAEVLTMAARVNSIYSTGEDDFAVTTPWYQSYVDYCVSAGIVSAKRFADLSLAATRTQVAEILAATLPAAELAAINNVEYGAIPDLSTKTDTSSIYKLYRAGILTGSDEAGTFNPAAGITRAEMAAVITRMADKSLRKSITLKKYDAEDGVTTAAQMTEALSLARYTITDAYKNAAQAIELLSEPTTAAMGGSVKMATVEELLMASQHLENVVSFCEGKSQYAEVSKNAKQAAANCKLATQYVLNFSATTSTADQNTAAAIIEAAAANCAAALGE